VNGPDLLKLTRLRCRRVVNGARVSGHAWQEHVAYGTDEQDRKALTRLIKHDAATLKAKLSDPVSDPLIVLIDRA
jgi:hypothetical protein